jgi:hypothetical protein
MTTSCVHAEAIITNPGDLTNTDSVPGLFLRAGKEHSGLEPTGPSFCAACEHCPCRNSFSFAC